MHCSAFTYKDFKRQKLERQIILPKEASFFKLRTCAYLLSHSNYYNSFLQPHNNRYIVANTYTHTLSLSHAHT